MLARRDFVTLATFLVLGSCRMMGNDASVARSEAAIQALQARVDAHHRAVAAASDAGMVRQELDSHPADIGPLFREMVAACDAMMSDTGDAAIAAADYDLQTDFMMAAVREHVSQMSAAPDLAVMNQLCDAHVDRVQAMTRHMQAMVDMMKMMMSSR